MGRNALIPFFFLLFLALFECSSACEKSYLTYACRTEQGELVPVTRGPFFSGYRSYWCERGTNMTLAAKLGIRVLNSNHCKLEYAEAEGLSTTYEISGPFVKGPTETSTSNVDAFEVTFGDRNFSIYSNRSLSTAVINSIEMKVVVFELRTNESLLDLFENSTLKVRLQDTELLLASWNLEDLRSCISYAMNTTQSTIEDLTTTVGIDLSTTVIPIETQPHSNKGLPDAGRDTVASPVSANQVCATDVVSLPTVIAATSVLGVIIILLCIVIFVLCLKLRGLQRQEKDRRATSLLSSSLPSNSSKYELDRNSQKRETWENRKSKERRRTAVIPSPAPEENLSQKENKKRPKLKKTKKDTTLGSFDA